MKVILIQNVSKLGQKDDVKEVKTGYWRNFLSPEGLAVMATPKLIEQALKRRGEITGRKEAEAEKIAKEMEKTKDMVLALEVKADEKGNLFAGISKEIVSDAVKEQMKIDIPADFIEMEKPIKKTGSYEIPVGDLALKIEVKPE